MGAVRATTPCHQWTRPQQLLWDGPGSSWPESASPLPSTPGLWWWGTPKAILKAPEKVQVFDPTRLAAPHPCPQATLRSTAQPQAPRPASACFPLPQPLPSGPVHVTLALDFLSDWSVLQALQRSDNGHFPCGQLQAPCLSSLWQGPILGRGLGLGPESSHPAAPSQSEFNKSVCPLFCGVDALTAKGASFMVWACVCLGDTSLPLFRLDPCSGGTNVERVAIAQAL